MKDLDKLWVGLVEDNKDPDRLGRVRVRVQSIFDDIDVEDIPWANPIKSLSGKSFEIPAIGKMVSAFFPNDNIYEPYFMYSEHYNINILNRLKNLSDEEYVNYVAILLEHRTQIYADDTNLTLDYKYNKITIDDTNINLELKDGSQKLNLGCSVSTQQAVLGTRFFEWMDKFIKKLSEPTSLIGNMGAPILKSEIDLLLVEYQTLRKDFVSDYVNIVDNRKVQKLKRNPNSNAQMHDGIMMNNAVTKDQNLKNKILDQFKNNNDTLVQAQPSNILKKTAVKTEDPNGEIMEGMSEIPFGMDEHGNDVHAIKISELNGTETSFTHVEYYSLNDSIKANESEVTVAVLVKNSPQEIKYVTKEEADKIREKELKDAGVINYENTTNDTATDIADPDDIISGVAFEDTETTFEDIDPDESAYNYDPNATYIFKAPDGSLFLDKSSGAAGASAGNSEAYSNTATSSFATGKGTPKTKSVPGPPKQTITNGKVPDKYMKRIKAGDVKGTLNGSAYLEKHAAKWFEKLQEAYHKEFKVYIYVTDSFRTYEGQLACKQKWVAKGHPEKAAAPGTSLHGWGIAVDIGDATRSGSINFNTPTYNWLRANAPRFKYDNPTWARPGAKNPEPWHWEYQGSDYCSVEDI